MMVPISSQVPARYREYFLAVMKLLTYEDALVAVEKRDPEILDVFANKIPRYCTTRRELWHKVREYEDFDEDDKKKAKLYEQAKSIVELFDRMVGAKSSAEDAKEQNDQDNMFYYLSKEYALSLYIRGAISLFKLREEGTDLPENIDI